MKTIAVVSGGMDSVTLVHELLAQGDDVSIVSFNYGQRHSRELAFAAHVAERYDLDWNLIDLRSMAGLLKGSALTDETVAVPDGHYAAESMKDTVVPNRNMVMLAIAGAAATANGASTVAIGVHAGDHHIYPDCRPKFIDAMNIALCLGNLGLTPNPVTVAAPFIGLTKQDIVVLGETLAVPWDRTWSCYKGGPLHCGRCGTCTERKEAFVQAGVADPTEYQP